MWLVFALMAPFFFAVVHVLDEHCVDNILEKPWMGVITSAATSSIAFFAIPFLFPFINWGNSSLQNIFLAIFVGIIIQTSQFFYFQALSYSEAGIVSAYWNFIPAILPIASFILFKDILAFQQYLGIAILITASTSMCLLDYHWKTRLNTFFLMIVASLMQVIAYLIMSQLYANQDFLITFFSIVTGIILTGLFPLFFRIPRNEFIKSFPKINKKRNFFIAIEGANLLALACAQVAIMLGDASLVSAAETTMPAFTFLISIPWINHAHSSGKALWNKFPIKMIVVTWMIFGVWMIS